MKGYPQRARFTLIELLVVVAIIGILASMLLPALTKARDSARGTKCMGNLKQISMAGQMYRDEYEGYLPPAYMEIDSQWHSWTSYLFLGQYMGIQHHNRVPGGSVFFCPAARGLAVDSNADGFKIAGYGQNAHLGQEYSNLERLSRAAYPTALLTHVDCMSERWSFSGGNYFGWYDTVAFVDKNNWTAEGAKWNYSKRHNQRTNLAFADGHATTLADLRSANANHELTAKPDDSWE